MLLMLHHILDKLIWHCVAVAAPGSQASTSEIIETLHRVAQNMIVLGRHARLAQELAPTGYMFSEAGRAIIANHIVEQIVPVFVPGRHVQKEHCTSMLERQVSALRRALTAKSISPFTDVHVRSARFAIRLLEQGWTVEELDALSTRALSTDLGPVDLVGIIPEQLAAKIQATPQQCWPDQRLVLAAETGKAKLNDLADLARARNDNFLVCLERTCTSPLLPDPVRVPRKTFHKGINRVMREVASSDISPGEVRQRMAALVNCHGTVFNMAIEADDESIEQEMKVSLLGILRTETFLRRLRMSRYSDEFLLCVRACLHPKKGATKSPHNSVSSSPMTRG